MKELNKEDKIAAISAIIQEPPLLVLSRRVRDVQSLNKEKIPRFGGLPLIRAHFSRSQKDEKRNSIFFCLSVLINNK